MSTALLPMRLNICDWPFAIVYMTPPLHHSFFHCLAKAITLRLLIILCYIDANIFPSLYIAFSFFNVSQTQKLVFFEVNMSFLVSSPGVNT